MSWWSRKKDHPSRWELRTEESHGSQELYVVRGLARVFIGCLYTSPVQSHYNIPFIEKAMLLVDILNHRELSADDMEAAVDRLRQDLPPKGST